MDDVIRRAGALNQMRQNYGNVPTVRKISTKQDYNGTPIDKSSEEYLRLNPYQNKTQPQQPSYLSGNLRQIALKQPTYPGIDRGPVKQYPSWSSMIQKPNDEGMSWYGGYGRQGMDQGARQNYFTSLLMQLMGR